jgi:serine phosphatase RsbU (regulator of sigma subunit)
MTYLAETSELLGQSLDVDLAVAVVPQVVVPRLGRWCAVHLVAPSGGLRLAALTHADEDALPELRAVLDPDARPGLPAELRNRLAEVVRDGTSAVRFAVPTDGIALPLRARGRTLGTLLVGRPPNRPHSPEDVVLAGDVARRAALAIHNAQSTGAHVAVSQALQQALLPRALPVVPGLDFAAEYLPASTGSDVGGDFYDVFTVDHSNWLVSIGDVCGKGARAAARTGLVRDVLRVLVRDDRSLPRAIELLNDVMIEANDPLQFCTLAAAMVSRRRRGSGGQGDPRGGLDVELVLAGHVQPVLVRADGTAELIGTFGTAVGLVPTVRVSCTQHRVGPGDTLLVYTDGVTERRRGREQFGGERLLTVAARAAGRPAVQVVGAVREAVERFSTEPLDDDVALLAVRAAPQ